MWKVLIEVPDNWLDADSPMIWASKTIRDQVQQQIIEVTTEQFLSKIELPPLFKKGELETAVKDRIVTEMARKAIRGDNATPGIFSSGNDCH